MPAVTTTTGRRLTPANAVRLWHEHLKPELGFSARVLEDAAEICRCAAWLVLIGEQDSAVCTATAAVADIEHMAMPFMPDAVLASATPEFRCARDAFGVGLARRSGATGDEVPAATAVAALLEGALLAEEAARLPRFSPPPN